MSDDTKIVEEKKSFLEMSDEEMMNASLPDAEVVQEDEETPAEVVEPAETADETAAEDTKDAEDEAGEAKAEDKAADVDDTPPKDKETAEDPGPDKKIKAPEEKKPAGVDFEAEYNRILTPFRANGRDIQVKTVDDAIQLMQQGANYSKKMAALKPNLKLMKMLENNGLMSEEKISFLIDLGKKDPGAIQKLVKDSGLDPMDFDADKASTYRQPSYAVDDRELELDTVLDELKDSPSYTRTLDVVSNKWDAASKQVVSQSPQLLTVINDHIASGIYDLISTEVEREQMLGRLKGLSNIEAYRQVGDAIQARGGFDHLGQSQTDKKNTPVEIVQPKPKQVDDDKLKEKRRAASSTKPAAPSTTPKDFNPLSMSDAEFEKLSSKQFL